MNRLLRHFIFGIAVLASGTAMGNVTFFETENFAGRQITVDQSQPNFSAVGFRNGAQSAIVDGDSWELCLDQNFSGGCTVLAPGRYPNLGWLSGRVSSARQVGTTPAVGIQPPGSITFYETENFGGRQISTDRPLSNLNRSIAGARPQSAIVEGGSWQVCADYNFGGDCTVLGPGRYPILDAWSDRISSARPFSTPMATLPPPALALQPKGGITFFESENFGGSKFMIDQPDSNFASSHAVDRYQSAIVEGGAWELCVDADFRGGCRIFVPGRYSELGSLSGRISSVRPSYDQRGEMPRDGIRGRASATLFSGPNLTGHAFSLSGEGQDNLNDRFNDRASSLRVDRGYWIFCSEADFGGECRTFGPGEYASLPGLNNVIASGRRISNYYPYDEKPDWQRDSFHQSLNYPNH
jgi:Beta/Gamma crystallin